MIDKGEVIKMAFLKLGKNSVYNDNRSDEYKVALFLLENIVKNIAKDSVFLFNSATTLITKIGQNALGENRFNLPIDYLNIIRCNGDYRIEGEFIYSPDDTLAIQYSRNIPLDEYPDSMFDYIVIRLCKEMALAFNGYSDRYPAYAQEEYGERIKIINQQGFSYKPWG